MRFNYSCHIPAVILFIKNDLLGKLNRRLLVKEKKVQKMISEFREIYGNRMDTIFKEQETLT